MDIKILRLIFDYSINKRNADKEFVERLIDIVVNSNELNDYVKNLYFYEENACDDNGLLMVANYNVIDRYMGVNTEAMGMYIESCDTNFGSTFSDIEQIFYNNFLISHVVLHELEHATQNKKYNSLLKDTETTLIRMAFSNVYMLKDAKEFFEKLQSEGYTPEQIYQYLKNETELYKKYYKYNPTERLAEIKTYDTLVKVSNHIQKEIPNLCEYEIYNYLKSLLCGYEVSNDVLCIPTITYINGMGYRQKWSEFEFYDQKPNIMNDKIFNQHSFMERLAFGLPVTAEEYINTNKVLSKYDKFQ